MKTNRITRVRKAQIIALRDEGYTHQYIAEKVGCHRNTVGTVLRDARIK
ncbi:MULTISPECIES: helix-turn-helix domain-containing protein [Thalassolituus]